MQNGNGKVPASIPYMRSVYAGDEAVLLKHYNPPESLTLKHYQQHGGYRALKKAFSMEQDAVIEEVKAANLRGRGGAGFPAGLKWSFMPKESDKPSVLVCNADESEPGTFKDRALMNGVPHMLLEGMIIAAYAMRASLSYIYIRGEMVHEAQCLENAIAEAYAANLLGKNILGSGYDLEMAVHRGAGAYICGEETGLLESLEGKRGWPRTKPPFPAQYGAFGYPTTVNNVETLACVPHIINNGAAWFKSLGPEQSPGPKLYCVSGHVKKPGLYEFPMGINMKTLIYDHCGGMLHDDRKLKAVIPGGSSVPVITADEVDVAMDFNSLSAVGSMLGSAGMIVMDESVCMVDALLNLEKFYAHESCGQCTPCREGTPWLRKILTRIEHGQATMDDIDLLQDVADKIEKRTICPLGDAAAWPVQGMLKKFRHEFEEHVKLGRCPINSRL